MGTRARVPRGHVATRARRYGERAAATLVEKVLSAITYCHHHGIVHRDIKLDNIMYESNNVRPPIPLPAMPDCQTAGQTP